MNLTHTDPDPSREVQSYLAEPAPQDKGIGYDAASICRPSCARALDLLEHSLQLAKLEHLLSK